MHNNNIDINKLSESSVIHSQIEFLQDLDSKINKTKIKLELLKEQISYDSQRIKHTIKKLKMLCK